jgi:hypothetical protein
MPSYEKIIARTPAARWSSPDELAGAVVYLASQASDFVTGTILFVDGGFAIRSILTSHNKIAAIEALGARANSKPVDTGLRSTTELL